MVEVKQGSDRFRAFWECRDRFKERLKLTLNSAQAVFQKETLFGLEYPYASQLN